MENEMAETESVGHVATLEAMRRDCRIHPATDAALDFAIRALRQGGGWIPVSERLPGGYVEVIAWTAYGYCFDATYQMHDGGTDGRKAGRWYDNDDQELQAVTHWQPLPPAPTAKDEQT
jgi:hypothetical protein